jgi:glycosyltransferase involved in cell wall biosynthesis
VRLRLYGRTSVLGGGVHYDSFCAALAAIYCIERQLVQVDATSTEAVAASLASSTADDVHIWFWHHAAVGQGLGTHVVWAIFEADRLNPSTLACYARAHVLWVPSAWGQRVLLEHGIEAARIDLVPEGVNPELFHPFVRSAVRRAGQPFRFLTIGKYEQRKGYDQLLAAFAQAFQTDPQVELLIKGDYFLDHQAKREQLTAQVAALGLSNVKLYWGNFDHDLLFALYNYADAFVYPSRAEGWGLPLLEAAACGLPLVSTYYSGHSEFLQHLSSSLLPIDFTLEPIRDPEFARFWPSHDGSYGRWALPDVDSLAQQLITMRADYPRLRDAARLNSQRVRQLFDWGVAAHRALDHLEARGLLRPDYNVEG